jgi:hypothetical protein
MLGKCTTNVDSFAVAATGLAGREESFYDDQEQGAQFFWGRQ